jgi:hypothetical protein
VPNFSKAWRNLCIEAMGDRPARRALDLGCAPVAPPSNWQNVTSNT